MKKRIQLQADAYDVGHSTIDESRFNIAFSMLKKQRILDIGADTGDFSRFLADNGFDVYAVDAVDKAIESIKAKGITAYKLDVEEDNLPFEDNYFDSVYCGEIIEHLLTPDHLLKECKRVLKREGVLVVTVPNACSIRNRIKVLLGVLPDVYAKYNNSNAHMRDYDIKCVREMLDNSGFLITQL